MSRALVLCALVPLAACDLAVDPGEPPVATRAQSIIGGTPDSGDNAIVMTQTGGGCTGTLVSPKIILSAGHCVSDAIQSGQTGSGVVYFGAGGASDFFETIGIADMVMYRLYQPPAFLQYDIAMIRLEQPAPDTITPIPINVTKLDQSYLGLPLRTVGFGMSDGVAQTGFGTKRQIQLTLDELTYFHIGLGDADSNICQGDSGGPTLAVIDGAERVVGVSSFGSDACRSRSYISRTDLYQPWLELVMDSWDGPCQFDGTCVTDGCRTPDPDCDEAGCGFDGGCGEDCAAPDLDCPLGARVGEECGDAFDCESRVCITAPDAPEVSYCSTECDPALGADACDPQVGACIEQDGRHVCVFDGTTPGIQGAHCSNHDDCRAGLCDPDDRICVEQCGAGFDACPEGFECRDFGKDQACRLPAEGGCGCRTTGPGGAAGAALLALAVLATAGRRRPRR